MDREKDKDGARQTERQLDGHRRRQTDRDWHWEMIRDKRDKETVRYRAGQTDTQSEMERNRQTGDRAGGEMKQTDGDG